MYKIAIFCHDHMLSGANLSLLDWISDFDFSKNELIIVLPRYNKGTCEAFYKKGVKKIIIGHYIVKTKKLYKLNLKSKIKECLKYVYFKTFNILFEMILISKLKKENIKLIHSNSFAVYLGAKIAKKMDVHHIWHIREFMEEDHQITHYNKNLITNLCEYSHAIFISDVIANKYKKIYNFKDSFVIYNKILYDNSYLKKRIFMEDDVCKIIMVGTLSKNKGHIDALNALKKLNDSDYNCVLYICGLGPYDDFLKDYVETEKISNVQFLGHISNVNEIRKNVDIALMCSENEALGRVTVEAQYYENLIIGANQGCTPYIIKDKITGLLYEKNKENDLFNKLVYCINNRNACINIINNAKSVALNTFNRNICDDIVDIYFKLLDDEESDCNESN